MMQEFHAELVAVTAEHSRYRRRRRQRDLGECYRLGRLSRSACRLFHVRRSTGFRYVVPIFQFGLWVPDPGSHSMPAPGPRVIILLEMGEGVEREWGKKEWGRRKEG